MKMERGTRRRRGRRRLKRRNERTKKKKIKMERGINEKRFLKDCKSGSKKG